MITALLYVYACMQRLWPNMSAFKKLYNSNGTHMDDGYICKCTHADTIPAPNIVLFQLFLAEDCCFCTLPFLLCLHLLL